MISNDGLELVKYFESCRLIAYQDSAGIWTTGYGHTKDVNGGMKITQEMADGFLFGDLTDAENRVYKYVKAPINQNELDTLISCSFNLRSFPKLAAYLNNSKELFLSKLILYCHDVQGHELLGLKRRRYAERMRFEGMGWMEIKPIIEKMK